MPSIKNEPQTQALGAEELRERAQGQHLHEMTQTPGFTVLKEKLDSMAFHSWIDPREIVGPDAKREWEWRELNGFHAANNAKELLEWIQQVISRAEYLEKKRRGELATKPFTIN